MIIMAAAAITPTLVMTSDLPYSVRNGTTSRRIKETMISITKATQNDWVVLSSYGISATKVIGFYGNTKTSANAMAAETLTYDDDDAKLIFAGAATGTAEAWVKHYE